MVIHTLAEAGIFYVLNLPSGKFTLLRLIPTLLESDGRFVHSLFFFSNTNFISNFTFESFL